MITSQLKAKFEQKSRNLVVPLMENIGVSRSPLGMCILQGLIKLSSCPPRPQELFSPGLWQTQTNEGGGGGGDLLVYQIISCTLYEFFNCQIQEWIMLERKV
ncbi:hypothetical protein GDO81_016851 [Engystomops pustulosus]|uniref:Uncharacterized protein n=1 Tax=Engystomops pustulosus TaxID=76066 RepID=A0AAV7ABB3_ENGPU|nr:hypothetical protein GDO81_016851 [Engystomops pustulosus]